jgi:capsular exopolysaccharide synthesis family protein
LEQAAQGEEVVVPEASLDEAVAMSQEIQQLTARLQQAKAAHAEIREGSGLAAQNRRAVEDLEQQVKIRSAQIRDELRVAIQRRHRAEQTAGVSARIGDLQAQIAAYDGQAEYLKSRLDEYQRRLSGSSAGLVDLDFAQRDLIRAEDVHERLCQRINELRTEARAPARVTLLKAAAPPLSPVELMPWKQFLAVCVAAMAFPFGLALVWEFRSQRVGAANQIQDALCLPILAEVTSLPRYPRLTNRHATDAYHAQRAAFENSIHYLCRNLLLSAEHSDSHVFAVTSAVSGEGKTNLASVLSISMALASHESVLLIDGDMRRPDLHAMFDLELSPGLAELLSGNCDPADAVHATQSEGVSVIPAGRLGAHPHSVLRKDRFAEILERLRSEYRYIIIDTPPVLSVGETLSVCNLVDGVILCAMRDVSLRPQIEEAYSRLNLAGANMFGVVLNGVTVKAYSSRYGDYHYSPRSAV